MNEGIQLKEKTNSGTTITKNDFLEKNGYLIIKNLYDEEELYHPVPFERGTITYFGKVTSYNHDPGNQLVPNSLQRINHPQYKKIGDNIRLKIEKEVGKLCFYSSADRFYFDNHNLPAHLGDDRMEIGVMIPISNNLKEDWPVWVKTPDKYNDDKSVVLSVGENHSIVLEPGDGLIYKGCERPIWRETIPTPRRRKRDWLLRRKEPQYYYHELIFYYVLEFGARVHCI